MIRTPSNDPDQAIPTRSNRESEDERRDVRAAVDAIRGGDRDAFSRIVERYQRRLFGLVQMMVRQPAAAEEVTQDAFVRAFTCLDRYDAGRPFYPWLAAIAVRLAQSWLRRHARVTAHEVTTLDEPPVPDHGAAADQLADLITDENDRRVWRAVSALSSGERTAVVLFYREGMKVREIAYALGVTGGTVKTLLFRARRRLRKRLDTTGASRVREEPT